MKALVLEAAEKLSLREIPAPPPPAGAVVVAIRAAALNHRDEWIRSGQYAGLKFPCVLGSDGAGIVAEVGAGVDSSWIGREVVVNPSFGWGASERVQGPLFSILGMPENGTLAESVVVPVEQLSAKPSHLSWEEAAALPLAGLTAYRALVSRAKLSAAERVLITGIGGGAALAALQIAKALKAQVWVTSSSPEKIDRARALGADGGFNYREADWAAKAKAVIPHREGVPDGFDVIVDSAGGAGFDSLLDLAAPGGRIVFFGGTAGSIPSLAPRKVFWKQLELLGTTMGSPADWQGLIRLVNETQLRPIVSEVFAFDQAEKAFQRMASGGQFGKLVLKVR